MNRRSRALSGFLARLRDGSYEVALPSRLKVCPNHKCPRPWRTYAYADKCPFCGTPLQMEREAER